MQKINDIMSNIPLGIQLSNYFWCTWAIFMSKNKNIQFDYIKFAYCRF